MSKRAVLILACLTFSVPLDLNAQAWDPDVRLTNNTAGSYTNYNNAWCIAVSGDTVHVIWFDERDGNEEIYYKRSIDGGTNWGSDTRLTNYSGYSGYPSLAVSGSNVHVVWMDYRDGNAEIYYKRSTNNGISWGGDTRLTNNSSTSNYPSVAVSGSNVHVVWMDERDGNFEIYYKRSTNGGTNWGTDTRLTNNGDYSSSPSVAVSGSNVHVVWHDNRDGDNEIYYKRSTNDGANWGSDTRLTNYSGYSGNASVAVSGSAVHVVWDDARFGTDEIFYRRSTNGGTNWGVEMGLTNEGLSVFPSVAVRGSNVHVVWHDNRNGNWEIYYKHGGEVQPDNQIKNLGDADYIGDGIYNLNGNNQTKSQTVAPGDTACYHVKIENDGDVSDTITVTGTGSVAGWTVKYYNALSGGTDITSDVAGSGWSTGKLNPGGYKEIRVEVIPDDDLPDDSTFDVLVTSTSKKDNTKKDAVKASSTTELEAAYQPDNQIKNFADAAYIGDGIYNTDGTNQTKAQAVDAGDTAIYHIKVENDGNTADTFKITGTAGNNDWQVKYYDALSGGTDITSQVTSSGWSTGELAAGAAKEIRVEVIPLSSALGNTSYDALVTSTSAKDASKKDAVKTVTTVNPFYRPDNQIKNSDEADYIGDGIYNDDGEDQTKAQTVDVGDTAVYHVKIENDGNAPDTFTITGSGSGMGWEVCYFDALDGGADITSEVTGSGWSSGELAPSEYKEIRVEVMPSSDPDTLTYGVLVTSTSKLDDTKLDAVKGETSVQGDYQPDNQIKNPDEVSYTGNDLYNTDGSSQTKSQNVGAGNVAIYHIRVENDGNLADTIIVTGTASNAGWTVRYFDALSAGTEITSDVTGAGWSTGELASGGVVEMRVEVTPPASAPDGTSYDVLVTSTSVVDDAFEDAVKATTAVETGGVEEKAAPLAYSLDISPLSSCKGVAVSYALPQSSNVVLSIYDAAGRAVKILNLGTLEAGSHKVELGEGSLSNGVYFVRLETRDKVLTRKLVLTR